MDAIGPFGACQDRSTARPVVPAHYGEKPGREVTCRRESAKEAGKLDRLRYPGTVARLQPPRVSEATDASIEAF